MFYNFFNLLFVLLEFVHTSCTKLPPKTALVYLSQFFFIAHKTFQSDGNQMNVFSCAPTKTKIYDVWHCINVASSKEEITDNEVFKQISKMKVLRSYILINLYLNSRQNLLSLMILLISWINVTPQNLKKPLQKW